MKKSLILIIIVLITLGYWFSGTREATLNPDSSPSVLFQPNPENAIFLFDDRPITLTNGRSEQRDMATGMTDEVWLLDKKVAGDLNNDQKNDTVILLARSGGGSGVFIYIATYISGPVSYKGTNAIFIGDRISPESVSIANGVITFKYLDRKSNEPFAAEPTVPVSKQFTYQNGEFVEK